MNKTPSGGGGVPELDPYLNSGVFLVGNDVVMDNVIVGSLMGEDENEAKSMDSQQQPYLSRHFFSISFFTDEEDLLAHAELLQDDDGDFFSHLDIPDEEDDANDPEFTPKTMNEGATKKFQVC